MLLYTLEIITQPKIEFSCSVKEHVDSSSANIIDHRENLIEIAVVEGTDMLVDKGDGAKIWNSGNVRIYYPDEKYVLHPAVADEGVDSQFTSVCVRIDEMKLERHEVDNIYEAAKLIEGLPSDRILMTEEYYLANDDLELIMATMRALISCRLDLTSGGRLRFISKWYELMYQLDSTLRAQILSKLKKNGTVASSLYYHVYRMKKYVSEHLTEKISVAMIAEAEGLTSDYAGRLFMRECGINLTEYIIRSRVSLLRSLICSERSTPISELCVRAGFSDQRYDQRVFKRYAGFTMLCCRQLNAGMTLLHSDPWKSSNLERDIFVSENNNEI